MLRNGKILPCQKLFVETNGAPPGIDADPHRILGKETRVECLGVFRSVRCEDAFGGECFDSDHGNRVHDISLRGVSLRKKTRDDGGCGIPQKRDFDIGVTGFKSLFVERKKLRL